MVIYAYETQNTDSRKEKVVDMDRTTIEARAVEGFFKSYVRNIQLAEQRAVKDHAGHFVEKDYTFDYKGKSYRVDEHLVPNPNGEVKYSMKTEYETVAL